MPIPRATRPVRGVSDIRTHSGTSDQETLPYQAYLRIAILEMERHRRNKERQSAMKRLETVDARSDAIDAEKKELLQKLGREIQSSAAPEKTNEAETEAPENATGFKIQY